MTTDDYGRRVALALRAVQQLHQDAGRLLQDCDGTVGKGLQLATKNSSVTKDTYWTLGKRWMPEGAFRCYSPEPGSRPGLIDVVCACFYGEKVAVDEPALIVGRYEYRLAEGVRVQDLCDGWDVWYLLADHCDPRPADELLSGGPVEWEERQVEWFRLVSVPLFSVRSMDDVVRLMERVRAAGS